MADEEQSPIISRKQARALGLKHYFTGKPCKHGHLLKRWTNSAKCVRCALDLSKNSRMKKPELYRGIARRTREKHLDARRADTLRWLNAHPEKRRAANLAYEERHKLKRRAATKEYSKRPEAIRRRNERNKQRYAANRDKERARHAAQYRANPARFNERRAFRRARKRQATPPWVDRKKLREIYVEAKRIGMTVDHVIPLQHPLVCGLHVPWNLQFLTREENTRKGNRFTP